MTEPATLERAAPARAPARLGGSLRSVLVTPGDGFASVLRSARRRARAGISPAEGWAPYVLAGLGGAALMVLWLKIGGLLGVREVKPQDFRWDFVLAALIGGGVLGLLGQGLWGWLGKSAAGALGRTTDRRDLRIVWGASVFPMVIGLVVLLPLDLVIVGSDTFTTFKLDDAVATGWAALSIAAAIAMALWSALLFVRGAQVATNSGAWRALLLAAVGVVSAAGVATALIALLSLAPGNPS